MAVGCAISAKISLQKLLLLLMVPGILLALIFLLQMWPEAESRKGEATLLWKDLRKLDLDTGQVPDFFKELEGQRVRIPGFVVPLEDDLKSFSEFVLVPTPMACIHVPAPPPNQIVLVELREPHEMFDLYTAVWAIGDLKVEQTRMTYGPVGYQMKDAEILPYRSTN